MIELDEREQQARGRDDSGVRGLSRESLEATLSIKTRVMTLKIAAAVAHLEHALASVFEFTFGEQPTKLIQGLHPGTGAHRLPPLLVTETYCGFHEEPLDEVCRRVFFQSVTPADAKAQKLRALRKAGSGFVNLARWGNRRWQEIVCDEPTLLAKHHLAAAGVKISADAILIGLTLTGTSSRFMCCCDTRQRLITLLPDPA